MSQEVRKPSVARPSVARPSNLKTALVLGGIALLFFASVFVKFTLLS